MNIREYLKNYPMVATIIQEMGRSPDDVESITYSQDVGGYIDEVGIRRLVPSGNTELTVAFFDGSKQSIDISKRRVAWVPVIEEVETANQPLDDSTG